ncbi:MAG: MFS transporter [Asgard group archaeon]|nr:MFS transporter [Asgard group archaeon]
MEKSNLKFIEPPNKPLNIKEYNSKMQKELSGIGIEINKSKVERKYFFIIGIFSFGFNFITTAEYVFFRKIMSDINITSAIQISILLGCSLFSLCIGALIGGILNDSMRSKYGQRAPAIFLGSLITACLFLIIPLVTKVLSNFSIIYALLLVILIISHITLGFAYSPWLALIPDLFTKKERFNAGIALNVFSALGAAFAVLLFSYLVDNNLSWLIWIITAIVFGSSAIITALLIPKINPDEKSKINISDVWKIPKTIWQHGGRNWVFLLIIGVFWAFSSHLVETSIIDSLVMRFNETESKASLSTNILMGGYIAVLLIPILIISNKISKKRVNKITVIIYFSFCIFLALIPNFNWIYFIVLFGGIGNILLSTIQISLPAEQVPKGKEASFLGVFFVFSTIAKPFATFIQGVLLENNETNTSIKIFGGYPWIFLLAGLMMILTLIPLSFIGDMKNKNIENKEKERIFTL